MGLGYLTINPIERTHHTHTPTTPIHTHHSANKEERNSSNSGGGGSVGVGTGVCGDVCMCMSHMTQSVAFFEEVWNNRIFAKSLLLLFLNKMDEFAEKVSVREERGTGKGEGEAGKRGERMWRGGMCLLGAGGGGGEMCVCVCLLGHVHEENGWSCRKCNSTQRMCAVSGDGGRKAGRVRCMASSFSLSFCVQLKKVHFEQLFPGYGVFSSSFSLLFLSSSFLSLFFSPPSPPPPHMSSWEGFLWTVLSWLCYGLQSRTCTTRWREEQRAQKREEKIKAKQRKRKRKSQEQEQDERAKTKKKKALSRPFLVATD